MNKLKSIMLFIVMFVFSTSVFATDTGDRVKFQNTLKQYFNKVNVDVKDAQNANEKRAIMNDALVKLDEVFEKAQVQASDLEDKKNIEIFRNEIQEKINELNGIEGFQKVADRDLNNFADYLQNNMENADRYVVISLTTLLIVALLLVLLL